LRVKYRPCYEGIVVIRHVVIVASPRSMSPGDTPSCASCRDPLALWICEAQRRVPYASPRKRFKIEASLAIDTDSQ